ncbi:MAG TPA: hypothetical protein VNQ76_17315 [Planctomicrobium sp.]|nr:hypothetical protein [Planctomicrobium sp.]
MIDLVETLAKDGPDFKSMWLLKGVWSAPFVLCIEEKEEAHAKATRRKEFTMAPFSEIIAPETMCIIQKPGLSLYWKWLGRARLPPSRKPWKTRPFIRLSRSFALPEIAHLETSKSPDSGTMNMTNRTNELRWNSL